MAFGLSSCARGNSNPGQSFLTIQIELTYRASFNPELYNYIIAFSKSTSPLTPTQPPPDEYFPTPGRNYDVANPILVSHQSDPSVEDGLLFYYQNFFNTWSDYIILTNENGVDGAHFYPSGGTSFGNTIETSAEHLAIQEQISFQSNSNISDTNERTITLRFQTNQLSGSGSNLFFTFITTQRNTSGDNSGTGNLIDTLDIGSSSITLSEFEQVGPLTEAENDVTEGGADLVQWKVSIF
jgi:hypothetical protein